MTQRLYGPPAPAGTGRTPVALTGSSRLWVWLIVALVGLAAYVSWFTLALEHGDYDAWGTLLIGPALVIVSLPLLRRAVRIEADRKVGVLIVCAFFVKLAMAFVNHAVAFGIYGGVADAHGYHGAGVDYSAAFRAGNFALAEQGEWGRRFIDALTGAVYTITGPSKLGGYLVFAWFGFWGLYMFYRAFLMAMPEGEPRRYAVLLFLLPSTLFWTSAIGKEAWMTLTLGACALGAARLLTGRAGGLLLLSLGLAGSALCRPHMSFMILVALVAGYLLRRTSRSNRLGPIAKLAGLVVLLGVGSLVASRFAQQFELTSFDQESFQSVLDTAERSSGLGGSEFTNEDLPLPIAALGVLFRPLPLETHNLQTVAASVEGTAMLLLLVFSRRRLWAALRRLIANPYVLFCVVYTIIFLFSFSTFRNFGTLARERVQLFPLLLVLVSVPASVKIRRFSMFAPPPHRTFMNDPARRSA